MTSKLVLRNSDFKLFLECPRKFYLSYVRNLETLERKASTADVGTLVHAGLQAHYSDSVVDPIASIAALAQAEMGKFPAIERELTEAALLARIMVQGYLEWLEVEAVDHGLTAIAIEQSFETYITTYNGVDVFLTGSIDLIQFQAETAQYWVTDHKTVDSFGRILPVLSIDTQGQNYDLLVRTNMEIKPAGFLHNQLRRVKRTGTAKPPFYNREVVHFNDTQRESHLKHLQGTAENIVRAIEIGQTRGVHYAFPPVPTVDCSWKCQFVKVCPLMDHEPDGAKSMIQDLFKQKQPN